jgi:hypothetical protein
MFVGGGLFEEVLGHSEVPLAGGELSHIYHTSHITHANVDAMGMLVSAPCSSTKCFTCHALIY